MTSPSPPPAWATVDDLPASSAGMHTPTRWRQFLAMSTEILWAFSGRRWRGGPETVEAVLRADRPEGESFGWHRSWGVCSCVGPVMSGRPFLGHTRPTQIRLPHSDVTSVTSVTIDGDPFTAYRRKGSWLTRVDGKGWPMCGERAVVTYVHGLLPPAAGVAACVELAVELGRSASSNPDQPCRLPERVTSVSRQGISYEQDSLLDRFDFLDKGRTGLFAIDLFLASVNPKSRAQRATVWTPGTARASRR